MTQDGRGFSLTSLEAQARAVLDGLGIKYIAQFSTRTGFVIDFAIFEGDRKIAVEVDGPWHDEAKARRRDRFRDRILRAEGWEILRIHHTEIGNFEARIRGVMAER